MICQYRLVIYNNCTALGVNVGTEKDCVYVWGGAIWEVCTSAQFYCEHRTSLKTNVCV